MRILRTVLISGLTLAVSGCGYFDSYFRVEQLNKTQARGSTFTQQLTEQYRVRANESQELYNYEQASTNADRGMAAALGGDVAPHQPQDWELPQDKFSELSDARQRLIGTFGYNAKEKAPAETARAQAKFDCWLEDSAKTWNPDQFQTCRAEFLAAIEDVENAIGKPHISPATGMEVTASLDDARYYIFFDSAKANLTAEAKKSVATFAADIVARNPKAVKVYGYTDATGSKKANQRMSEKRAAAVAESLIRQGVPAKIVKAEGKGATNPLVPAAKSEPSNRRVEIVLQ